MEERGQNVVAAQRDQNGRQEAIVAATLSAYYEAMPEARIIETVAARFGCRRSTVRRCITGLNMLEAEEIPARALEVTSFRDAVNALGGGRPYLRNLRRERNEFLRTREQREGGDLWRADPQPLFREQVPQPCDRIEAHLYLLFVQVWLPFRTRHPAASASLATSGPAGRLRAG